jgi:hypothetical protein
VTTAAGTVAQSVLCTISVTHIVSNAHASSAATDVDTASAETVTHPKPSVGLNTKPEEPVNANVAKVGAGADVMLSEGMEKAAREERIGKPVVAVVPGGGDLPVSTAATSVVVLEGGLIVVDLLEVGALLVVDGLTVILLGVLVVETIALVVVELDLLLAIVVAIAATTELTLPPPAASALIGEIPGKKLAGIVGMGIETVNPSPLFRS